MTKHETPPYRMRIEDGRLVPVSAWDQERLSSFRNRSELTVQITQQKNRKLERKYWAILHEVIKSCPVKQRTAEDLHKAIRLKLGVVDAYFTVDGKLRVDVKSTTGMDDPEYGQFYEDAMGLLHDITGVDPEQLGAESPDVGEDDQPNTETSDDPPRSDDAGSDTGPHEGVASDLPADEADHGEGAELDTSTGTAPDPLKLTDEDKDNLLALIQRLKAAVGADPDVVKMARNGFAAEGRAMGKLAKEKAETIVGYFKDACGYSDEADARKALSKAIQLSCGIAQVDEIELGMV